MLKLHYYFSNAKSITQNLQKPRQAPNRNLSNIEFYVIQIFVRQKSITLNLKRPKMFRQRKGYFLKICLVSIFTITALFTENVVYDNGLDSRTYNKLFRHFVNKASPFKCLKKSEETLERFILYLHFYLNGTDRCLG